MKFKIRFADQIVGVFLLSAVVILIAILIFMGANQRWFSKDYHFRSRFKTGDNITVGMPIKLKGFQIGGVDSINLMADNSVEIDFHIFDTYYKKVTKDSILDFSVNPLGIGSGGLNFYPGHSGKRLPELSFITSLDFKEGKELVENGQVDKPETGSAIPGIINSLPPLLEQTEETLGSINEFVEIINGSLKDETDLPMAEKVVGKEMYGQLVDTIKNFESVAKEAEKMGVFMNSKQPDISQILEEGREAISEGKDVMRGIKNNPLLRGGIPDISEEQTIFESYREEDF